MPKRLGIPVSVWNIQLTKRFDATLNSIWSRVNYQIQTPLQKQCQNWAQWRRDAKRRQEVSSVAARLLLCLGVAGGEMEKTMGRATKRKRGEEGAREKRESSTGRKAGRQRWKEKRREGREEEGERQMKTGETRGKETNPPPTPYALDCPLSVSGPLNGLLKSKLWHNIFI